MGKWIDGESTSQYGEFLTLGEMSEPDFRNECKDYTNFLKVFRDKIKAEFHDCDGIGEVCEYTGSAGCGLHEPESNYYHLLCKCNIEFTYCTQTSLGKKLDPSLKSQGKNKF